MRVLGVIPARGGSKGIPRKNVALLAGRPLIVHSCQAALESRRLDRVIVNTDDAAIAAVAEAAGVPAPFLRPPELARDETPIVEVLQHTLAWFDAQDPFRPDVLVLLQPTSPLRRAAHIDEAVALLETTGADTVVSVTEVPHQFNPVSVMRVNSQGNLVPFLDGPLILRRQDKPRAYARNGPAVLAVRREVVESGRLYGPVVKPYEMEGAESLDIDDAGDLEVADFWLRKRRDKDGE